MLETFQRLGGRRRRRVTPVPVNPQPEVREHEGQWMKKRDSLSLMRRGSPMMNVGSLDLSPRKGVSGSFLGRSSLTGNSRNGSSIDLLTDARSSAGSIIARGSWSAVLSAGDIDKLSTIPPKEIPVTDHPLNEMRVGKKLLDVTTKRLIVTLILLLLISPALQRNLM